MRKNCSTNSSENIGDGTFHGLFVVDIMALSSVSPCSCCSCWESASVLLGSSVGGGGASGDGSDASCGWVSCACVPCGESFDGGALL